MTFSAARQANLHSSPNMFKEKLPIHDQHTSVTYLSCILDENVSGESMATKTLGKINDRLRFLYRKQNFLDTSINRLLANELIQPRFDYAQNKFYQALFESEK